MKIDKVILATDSNPTYFQFWNPMSKVWKTKFNIDPVLIVIGDNNNLNLSEEYGSIILQKPVNNIPTAWTTTWSLFYFTKFFQDETCLIMGIDQLPMSKDFFVDKIKDINEDSYVMYISDAYGDKDEWKKETNDKTRGRFPTAYHLAKGKIFNEIYQFEKTFEDEILKLNTTENLDYTNYNNFVKWGIDESYASLKLRSYYKNNKDNKIVTLNLFSELTRRRISRVDLSNVYQEDTKNKINNGFFVEAHLPRPLNENIQLFNYLVENIRT